MEGVHSDDHNESVACTKNDDKPEEREMFNVATAPTRRKKRRALSADDGSFAPEDESSPQEMYEGDQNCTEEHPLQASVTTTAVGWVICTWEPTPILSMIPTA